MSNTSPQPQQNGIILITQLKQEQITIKNSQYCVKGVIEELIDASWEEIKLNKLYSKYLKAYSNMKTMDNMEELNTFIFNGFPFIGSFKRQDQEPTPLIIDSLLPISADIDAQNTFRKNNLNKAISEESYSKSRIKERQISAERKQKYTKLEITEISEEDGLTKELRKLDEEKNLKIENERKAQQKKRQLLQEKLKEKKKNQKQQKFSYDYNGQVIQIRLQSKANLVSKVINGLTNQNTKINKHAYNDPNPSEVQSTGKKDKKFFANSKRKDDVEFSDVKSLAENIKANVGIKYTYQGKTYEEKHKAVSVMQLRKTLSQRKISKEDYKRIRELNGNKKDYQQALKKINSKQEEKPQRAHSQAKRMQSRSTFRHKEKIHVNSNDLKGKLLEKNQPEYLSSENKQIETPPQNNNNRLGSIDSFNLEYLKTGGTLHANTSKEFYSQRSNNELPKITHTTLYSKMLPKGRERIKDANEIIRDLRKKFQEKLRI